MLITSLVLLPVVSALVFLAVDGTILAGVIAFYLAPGLIAMCAKKVPFSRVIAFSVLVSIPFTIIFDYVGTVSGLWFVPETVFPRFLGVIPVEDYLWLAAAVFTILAVSAVPQETKSIRTDFRETWLIAGISGSALVLFFAILDLHGPSAFVFHGKYLYMFLASAIFGLPAAVLWMRSRENFAKHAFVIGYFFFLSFVFEAIAVRNGWWEFNGQYLFPPVIVSGKVLPIEELFFVGIVGPILAILMYKGILRRRS